MTAGPRAEILAGVDRCIDDFAGLLREATRAAIVSRDGALIEAAFSAFGPLMQHVAAAVAAATILDATDPPPPADVQGTAPH